MTWDGRRQSAPALQVGQTRGADYSDHHGHSLDRNAALYGAETLRGELRTLAFVRLAVRLLGSTR